MSVQESFVRSRFSKGSLAAIAALLSACSDDPGAAPAMQAGEEQGSHEDGEAHGDEVHLAPEAIERLGVQIAAAQKLVLVPTQRAPAQVAFNSEGIAHVGIPIHGRVAELRVRLGDEVEPGAVLLVVESPELGEAQSNFLLKRSVATNSLPAVDLAQSAHERARGLYEKNQGIALTEVLKREAEYRTAQAALAAAQAEEDAARNRLRLLGMSAEAIERVGETRVIEPLFTVEAPIAGQVVEREVTLGELVGPDREALLVIANMGKLWVLADVPETRLRDVAVGARARVLLGSSGDHWCEGVVSFISPSINPATRSVQVRIEPTDRHPELRPGVFAQAEIETDSVRDREPQLAIPDAAVQMVEGSSAVFVPVSGEEGTFTRRSVTVGPAIGGFVPVLFGLVEGERYVSTGSFILKAELGKSSAEHDH
jgi:cobalt-zinc-cadmium efflux system membrane fusion protein